MGLRTATAENKGIRQRTRRLGPGLLVLALLTGCGSDSGNVRGAFPTIPDATITGFSGGCAPFNVYSQNRWAPLGAFLRKAPELNAEKIGGFLGQTPIPVDGYVHTGVPIFPDNPNEFQGETWFHYVAGGWITSAALRATPTVTDLNSSDGGPPAPLLAECEGKKL